MFGVCWCLARFGFPNANKELVVANLKKINGSNLQFWGSTFLYIDSSFINVQGVVWKCYQIIHIKWFEPPTFLKVKNLWFVVYIIFMRNNYINWHQSISKPLDWTWIIYHVFFTSQIWEKNYVVHQADSPWGKGEIDLQCIIWRGFLKHACVACDYSHVCHNQAHNLI